MMDRLTEEARRRLMSVIHQQNNPSRSPPTFQIFLMLPTAI